ncbi:conjugative transfer system coupling protein TraD [Vibrio alginolyticus]|uniref:conjugative transfer system coupling protein TraD n=1 Tax=Vibrio alginolyticus TaxID=663 RepID=UPI0022AA336F|nr:conjugative transfer system coupling protein TraD [Vibrio alginolyticus]MCZ2798928.1 conjugative transfer system coupling protein TraD [Vibrio alginolyticus]
MNMRDMNSTADLFRPEHEFYIGSGYLGAGIFTAMASGAVVGSAPFLVSALSMAMGLNWMRKSYPRIKSKMKLVNNYFYFEDINKIRKKTLKHVLDEDLDEKEVPVFLGKAFEWGAEHASDYWRISSMSTTMNELNLPYVFKRKAKKETELLGGKPYIHGIGEEKEFYAMASAFYAHTIILGLPGTGKTTLLNLLSTGTLNRGNFNLIIDPKPDTDWEKRMREECRIMGVPFYYFSTAHPSKSVRIDVLRDYEKITDIPSRILDVNGGDPNDPFVQFTWGAINQVVQAMHYVAIPAQLINVSQYLRFREVELAQKVLDKFFAHHFGSEDLYRLERNKMKSPIQGDENGSLAALIEYYKDPNKIADEQRVKAVEGIVSFVTHDKGHRSKMLASTEPLFDQLTASPLDVLMSPNTKSLLSDEDNTAHTVNLQEMLESGGCLYIALNSMADSQIAGAIAKLIISAVAAAASRRYSNEEGEGRRVSLFVDEAHAALNEKLIDILAVGRGAKFEVYLSTQTVNDLIAKADQATADRILGLASNMFALRVSDKVTKEFIASNFGTVDVTKITYALQDRAGTTDDMMGDAANGRTETIDKVEKDMFPAEAQGDMPNLQYIARLQNGQKIKGRVPILVDGKPEKSRNKYTKKAARMMKKANKLRKAA